MCGIQNTKNDAMKNTKQHIDSMLHTVEIAEQGLQQLKVMLAESSVAEEVTELLLNMKGRLVVSGMGKSGYIAHKIAASFASTGTPSLYVHPSEASHGDLGMISEDDIVLLLSNSGETSELRDVINYTRRFHIPLIAMTMKPESTLAKYSDHCLLIPKIDEASYLGAPTTSAMLMLTYGDALVVAVSTAKGITKDNYKLYHPGGKIGANLLKVSELMHIGATIPVIHEDTKMSEVLIVMSQKGFGCAIVTNQNEELLGVITDGDLRRHMEDNLVSQKASEVMTPSPTTITQDRLATEALSLMNDKQITSLIVYDVNKVSGILHIHDLLRAGVS